jgi:aldose 1-epimerase
VRLRSAALGTLELAVDGSWPWLQVFTGDTLQARAAPAQRGRSSR